MSQIDNTDHLYSDVVVTNFMGDWAQNHYNIRNFSVINTATMPVSRLIKNTTSRKIELGWLEIHAVNILIEGIIDASGCGYMGGGGVGGKQYFGGSSASVNGGGGQSINGHGGVSGNPYGWTGRDAGTIDFYSLGGGSWGGKPGLCGVYPGDPNGLPGASAGYLGNGVNGDTTEDESVEIGSGGGGGGGGEFGATTTDAGGGGASGRAGGGSIRLFASSSIIIKGSVLSLEGIATSGAVQAYVGLNASISTGGQGGANSAPGTTGGTGYGASGGAGGSSGPGAGGGILIMLEKGFHRNTMQKKIKITGTISNKGSGTGGTIKIFAPTTKMVDISSATLDYGRLYQKSIGTLVSNF